jgi:AbrB family looped-hinge helix DNA binding protein
VARVSISAKGQLVIPKAIRREVGLELGGKVEVRLDRGRIVLEPAGTPARWQDLRGVLRGTSALQDHLREHRDEVESDGQGT